MSPRLKIGVGVAVMLAVCGAVAGVVQYRSACIMRAALPGMAVTVLEHPQHLVIYALDAMSQIKFGPSASGPAIRGAKISSRYVSLDSPPQTGQEFHGFLILGSAEIRDAGTKQEVFGAIRHAILTGGPVYLCFEPEYGIHAEGEGHRVDALISCNCGNMAVYLDGVQVGDGNSAGRAAAADFDRIWARHGLPTGGHPSPQTAMAGR